MLHSLMMYAFYCLLVVFCMRDNTVDSCTVISPRNTFEQIDDLYLDY